MLKTMNTNPVRAALAITAVVLLAALLGSAEELTKPEVYQAQAMGTMTQMGQSFNVTVRIHEYSTPEERQALIDAFDKAGAQGLSNALSKMKSKGHLEITGTLGYDISFVRAIPTDSGRKIRVLTNRQIRFGEAWADGRSMDYNLSAVELDLSDVKGKSGGVLLPACMLKINKKTNEVEIETYQNPWKLTDVLDWNKK